MKKLKLVYENESDIPSGFAELYEERDGKWYLTGVEGMKTQADVDKLQGALKKERDARVAAEGKLKKFEALGELDLDELIKAKDEVEDLRAQLEAAGGDTKSADAIQKRVDAAIASERAKMQRDLDKERAAHETAKKLLAAEQGKVTQLDGTLRSNTIEGALQKAAVEHKVESAAMADVLMYRGVFELDADGKPVTKDGVGFAPGLSPSEWLAERKNDRNWWAPSVGGGLEGTTKGGKLGENPFKKETFNVTKAMMLLNSDPAKAETLARAAGHKSAEDAITRGGRAA
jgi:hypothetical protein